MLPRVVAREMNTSLPLWHTSITFTSVTGEAGSPYVASMIADTLTVFAEIGVLGFACSGGHDNKRRTIYKMCPVSCILSISCYEAT